MGETMNPGHLARLTPDTVQSVTFRAARRGRRGLDHDHVREFCQQVEAELAQLAAERAALQDEDHDDDEQRGGRHPAGVTDVAADLALGHPDDHSAEQRQREGLEAPDQRRRQRGHDEQGQVDDVQSRDRSGQDGGPRGQDRTGRPRGGGNEVRGPPHGRGHGPVLGHRAGGQPEPGFPLDGDEHDGHGNSDRGDDQQARGHGVALADVNLLRRQE